MTQQQNWDELMSQFKKDNADTSLMRVGIRLGLLNADPCSTDNMNADPINKHKINNNPY